MADPSWLPVAKKYLGFHETGNNLGIDHFIELAHTGEPGDAWCAIYSNACLEESGYRGTRSARARSYEGDPNFIELREPILGCIVTRWRVSPTDGRGHVYFFLGKNADGSYRALAGNEDDAVREYDESPDKVTGYWWPKAAPLPSDAPTADVLFHATGKMSIFGGPDDSGSGNPLEGLALFSSEAQMRQHGLGDYLLPSGPGLFRRLNPEKFYIACRWDYSETPASFLRDAIVIVEANGRQAEARPVDWGPNVRTGRVADLSPALAKQLLLQTDDVCTVTIKPKSPEPAPMPEPSTLPMPTPAPSQRPSIDPDQISAMLTLGMRLLQRMDERQEQKPAPAPTTTGANPMAALTAFLPWFISVLPQISTIALGIAQAAVSSGIMGPAIGPAATTTGQITTAGLISTLGVGLLNWIKDALQRKQQAKEKQP